MESVLIPASLIFVVLSYSLFLTWIGTKFGWWSKLDLKYSSEKPSTVTTPSLVSVSRDESSPENISFDVVIGVSEIGILDKLGYKTA